VGGAFGIYQHEQQDDRTQTAGDDIQKRQAEYGYLFTFHLISPPSEIAISSLGVNLFIQIRGYI
jgi:hypothetical protein